MGLPRTTRSGRFKAHVEYKQTSTPLGVPHKLVEEDNYRGHVVPGGTTVLANAWYACLPSPHQRWWDLTIPISALQGDDAQRNHVPLTERV